MSNEFGKFVEMNISGTEMVETVKSLYPKFDKTLLSKCKNGDVYGVDLRSDAMQALRAKYIPEQTAEKPRRKRDSSGHKLTCRIQCRLSDGQFDALQRHIRADGYATMQEWMAERVSEYLKRKEQE
ncbi:MAG: hypothetical protein Q4F79_13240 [Eubacteriales bacterium]|nr:hypothetical protein [Eubacteriales bacterium]